MAARDAAIKRFTEDPDCKIFLMSLKAGGVALNLTVASHVSNIFSYDHVIQFNLSFFWDRFAKTIYAIAFSYWDY